jgi:hypothetical protein
MNKLVGAALILAQLAAAPAVAATLEPIETVQQRAGAFAGARVRIAFGGREAGQPRLGLGVSPLRTAQGADGRTRTSFAEGLEFGSRAGSAPRLSIAGRSLDQIRLQADGKDRDGGVPTWVWIAGGAVVLLGAAFAAYVAVGNAATE